MLTAKTSQFALRYFKNLKSKRKEKRKEKNIPPTCNIRRTAKHLGQTGQDNIHARQNIEIDKVACRLIARYNKVVLVRQLANSLQVRRDEFDVAGQFTKQRRDLVAVRFQQRF